MNPRLIAENASCRYSSIRAGNGKWIVLQIENGYNALWTAAGERYDTLPSALHHSAQVVWDWDDLDKLWFVRMNALLRYNVVTKEITEVRTFDEYKILTASHAESDLTRSGYLALVGVRPDGVEVAFTYSVHDGDIGRSFPQSEPFDGIKVTESGQLLLSSNTGIYVMRGDEEEHAITPANGHACCAVHNGRDVLLWCNSNERDLPGDYPFNAVVMIDIESGADTPLKSFGWQYSMHISGEIVSVYDDPAGPQTKGSPNQIWRVPLDGTTPTMLHEWASPYNRDYQPRATLSADGKTVLFNVWDGEKCSVWQLDLPESTPNPVQVDSDEEGLISNLTPGNRILWVVREDGKTFDAYNDVTLPDGTLQKIDYPVDGVEYKLRTYQGGLRMFKTR